MFEGMVDRALLRTQPEAPAPGSAPDTEPNAMGAAAGGVRDIRLASLRATSKT
jgi:hypothetical protein